MAAVRLQRWAIILLAYRYDSKLHPMTKHVNADIMSRLLLGSITTADNDDSASYSISNILPQFQYIQNIYIWRYKVFHSCQMSCCMPKMDGHKRLMYSQNHSEAISCNYVILSRLEESRFSFEFTSPPHMKNKPYKRQLHLVVLGSISFYCHYQDTQ